MLEREFRNEDPTGKIIALVLVIVSLIGGGAFAVKLGLQGFPPLRMALYRCILGLIAVGGIGFYYGISMRMRFKELPRLLLIALLYILHTITLNFGTQLTTASRSTIFFTLYPLFTVLFGHFWLPNDRLSQKGIRDSYLLHWGSANPRPESERRHVCILPDWRSDCPACSWLLRTPYYTYEGICSRHILTQTSRLAIRLKYSLFSTSKLPLNSIET